MYLLLLGHGEEDEGKLDDVGDDLGLHALKLQRICFIRGDWGCYMFCFGEKHGADDDGDLAGDQPDVGGSEGAVWGALSLNSNAWVENGCGSRGWK